MRKFELNRKAQAFLIVGCVLPFVGLIAIILWDNFSDKMTQEEMYLEYEKKSSFTGKIDTLYRLKMNHNTLTLKAEKQNFFVPAKWEDKFQINDSISKKEGELFVEHYRDGKLLEVLDYHDIAKDMK